MMAVETVKDNGATSSADAKNGHIFPHGFARVVMSGRFML